MKNKLSGKKKSIYTKVVHAGMDLSKNFGALSNPVFQACTFAFPDAEQGAAIHEGHQAGYFYGRLTNPTQEALESALCVLENGESALAFSSGMAAIGGCFLSILKQGDHLVAPASIYASTSTMLRFLNSLAGIEISFIDAKDPGSYEKAIRKNTRIFFLESPANPTLQLCDMDAIVSIAKRHSILTVMDNTFATPVNQNPLDHGVDVVVHSLTKYMGGHADVLGGALVSTKEIIENCRWNIHKIFGGVIAPNTAWLVHRGIKTLALRMERHNENAFAVAQYLETHPKVIKVHYPGLESHPQHSLAKKQMRGFGGMIAFEVAGLAEGRKLVDHLKLCTLAVSLGDVSTLIQHSASMTHASVPKEQRELAGISDGLLRLSVGIEDKNDIIEDLKQGLDLL